MAQFGYPTSDVTRGNWTDQGGGATHWGNLDEVSYSDTDYIQLNNQTANTCEVGLGSVTDPQSSTGHIVHLRVRKTGTGSITLTAALYQGATLIATRNPTLTTSFADVSFTLTGAEADAITNYGDLRIRFTGTCAASGRYIAVSWVNLETPDVPANNYVLQTTVGVFTLTCNDAILTYLRSLVLKASAGVFVWTGNDAILDYHQLINYILWTSSGTFTLTGSDLLLKGFVLRTTTVGV